MGRRGPRGAGSFAALVAGASIRAEAGLGLAAAYFDVSREARALFRTAVLEDAARRDIDARGALLALLAVEDDPAGASELFEGLKGVDRRSGVGRPCVTLRPATGETGWLRDGPPHTAGLAMPLYGTFVEFFVVTWSDEVLRLAEHAPLLSLSAATERMERRGAQRHATAVVVERLVGALWQHRRRRGAVPASLAPLACHL